MTKTLLWLALAALQQPPAPDKWEKDIAAFEAQDKENPPPKDGIVFVGSSSIKLWDLKKAFPDLPCINRGFGGSEMGDSLRYADRIVIPYAPATVVVLAGGNDINSGKTPEKVCADYKELTAKIHAALPKTKIYFITLTPNVKRWAQEAKWGVLHGLIEAHTKTDPRLGFINAFPKLLDAQGKPRPEILRADTLHLNDDGYAILNEIGGPVLRQKP
mgnify:CR=1 FL=1